MPIYRLLSDTGNVLVRHGFRNIRLVAVARRPQRYVRGARPRSRRKVSHSRFEAANLERVSKYIAKSYWYLNRKPFDLRAADSATNQYDLAAALVPMAPGLPSLKERIISAYPVAVRAELSGKDTKRALRVISNARKRDWINSELEELEVSIKQARPTETLGAN